MMMATLDQLKLLHKLGIIKFVKRFSLSCESFTLVSFTIFEKLVLKVIHFFLPTLYLHEQRLNAGHWS